jgi:hypothetical protein
MLADAPADTAARGRRRVISARHTLLYSGYLLKHANM